MSPVSPAAVDTGDFTFSITADGTPLDDDLSVIRVDLWSALETATKASVVLVTDTSPGEPFSSKALATLERGKAIEIRAGYSVPADVIFSGAIVSHGVSLAAEASGIIVNAESAGIPVSDPDARDAILRLEYGVSIISFKAETKPGTSRLPELRGEVSFQGSALPQPGSIVELAGVGGSFDGDMFVSAVHHNIDNGNWTTHVRFREPPAT
jgi:phage protein D